MAPPANARGLRPRTSTALLASLCVTSLPALVAAQTPRPTTLPAAHVDKIEDNAWAKAATIPAPYNMSNPALLVHFTAKTRGSVWREATWREKNGDQIDLRYYSDDDSRALVAQHRPHFLETYDNALSPVERADYFRYLVLWVYGGLYVDSDIEFVRPVDQWFAHFGWDPRDDGWRLLETVDLVVGVEFPEPQTQYEATGWLPLQFAQFVFAGARDSDVLAAILDHVELCVSAVDTLGDVERTIERTGPAAFTRAILDEIASRGVVSQSLLTTHADHESDARYPLALLPSDELDTTGQLVPLKRAAVTPVAPEFRNRPYDFVLVLPYRAFAYHQAHGYATAAELTRHHFQNSWRSDAELGR